MDISQYQNLPGVYIIQSLKNFQYYIGSTSDIVLRLQTHNKGKVKSTKYQRPWTLKFFQACENITIAKRLEYELKKLKRKDYVKGIIEKQCIYGKLAQLL